MIAFGLTTRFRRTALVALVAGGFTGAPVAAAPAAPSAPVRGPVQVFVLAGQSNMEGKALASTLEAVINDPVTHDEFAHLKPGGRWAVRDDVWVTFLDKTVRGDDGGIPRFGPLTVGFGSQKQVRQPDGHRVTMPTLGPELGFGWVVGDRLAEPVLLIKAAWGGKSVRRDFRPPGAPPDEAELAAALARARKKNPTLTMAELRDAYGRYYRKLLEAVRRVLADLGRYCPAYDPKQGYELAGLVWFQGWNDGVGAGNPDYPAQLAQMIRDLRRDLGAPGLPVVIGELGVDGPEAGGWIAKFRAQQEAVAAMPEFRDNVRLARTAACWPTRPDLNDEWKAFQAAAKANTAKPDDDPTKVTPRKFYEQNWLERYRRELAYTSDKRYHYKGSGACYYRMGRAMGEAMIELLDQRGGPPAPAPLIQPWRRVALDPEYAGAWVVAGDLDGDGAVEIVSARNVNRGDVHHTSAVVAQRLDGSVLWRWGNPRVGRKELHHDVACQVYDWDGDGRCEVVLCAEHELVELDGRTGREKRRLPLPPQASDCLVFANLSGGPRATDFLVKTRYTQIWAFNRDGHPLWTVREPGGFRTAHQPVPVDLDGDGRDEIMAGYAMLNPDGSTRWVFKSRRVDQGRGHCDCFRLLRRGQTPAEFRFVLTMCGANGIALLDGNGRSLWEVAGQHFESVDVGRLLPDAEGLQCAVDIDHRPWGEGPLWVLDEQGRARTKIMTDYARHHALVDWTGDGVAEILIAQPRALFDHAGRRVATFAMDPRDDLAGEERLALTGDFTGDGVPDVALTTRAMSAVHIYRNTRGQRPEPPAPLGTGVNFTLY